jgi:hypothetical protein
MKKKKIVDLKPAMHFNRIVVGFDPTPAEPVRRAGSLERRPRLKLSEGLLHWI